MDFDPPPLARQLDTLIARARTDHDDLIAAIRNLDLELFGNDADVMRALESVRDGQERRAGDIARVLAVIQSRIGHVPPVLLTAPPQPRVHPGLSVGPLDTAAFLN